MNIGILDCKVGGAYIEQPIRYLDLGFDVITSKALDDPHKNFDILASTWTLLSERRLRNVQCRGVVVKDNDEPENVIKKETVQSLRLPPVKLIDNWGISTRVAWNLQQIAERAPYAKRVAVVADTPSHDALNVELRKRFISVADKLTPKLDHVTILEDVTTADVVIVHLGKADYRPRWFDQYLDALSNTALLISTTRGPIFSADALNRAIYCGALRCAVLDWAWQQEQLEHVGKQVILTNHTSYRSEESKRELTDVTIKAVKELRDAIGE